MKKVAIIGGGASGMIAAIIASKAKVQVDLFEKNSSLGKKVAIAGNGKCNITNANISAKNFFCKDLSFVNSIINTVNYKALEKLFLEIGIVLQVRDDGQVFPLSMDGKNVVELLEAKLLQSGVKIYKNCEITRIEKNESFTLHTNSEQHSGYEKVMLCSGSNAYNKDSKTPSYALAKDLGLCVEDAFASLVQLNLKQTHHKLASGVKVDANIKLQIEDKIYEQNGDVLFANYGISGLAVLDLSHNAALAKRKNKKAILKLDLFYEKSENELNEFLQTLYKKCKPKSLELFLKSIVHNKVATMLLQKYDLTQTINPKVIKKLCFILKSIEFEVHSTRDLQYAEVAGGGVDVSQIDKQTLMSKKIPGLYLGGEMLDVVGQRGGYNLHFAWACGVVCGKNMV